jgi:predicted PurR-regulated permease PerM
MEEPAGPDQAALGGSESGSAVPVAERPLGGLGAAASDTSRSAATDRGAPFAERRGATDRPTVRPPTPRVALLLVAAVVVAFLLYRGREALSPFVVGALLVYLLDPPVEWLSRRRLPRWIAVLVVYVVVLVLLVQALGIMTRPLVEQVRAFADDLPSLLSRAEDFYRTIDMPPALRQAADGWLAQLTKGGGIDPGLFAPVVNLTAGFVSGLFGYLIIPVWAFYLLKDRPTLTRAFDRSLPSGWRYDVWEVIHEVERVFGQWVRAQLILGLTVGVATFVGLEILNFFVDPIFGRFALLLAVSAGILELLPIIGPIIAAVPAVLLAATAGPNAAVAALLLYLLVQQIENNVLVPKIQGDAVELHPSVVMLSLVIGGAIAGLLGAILALPITAAGRNVFRYLFRRMSATSPAAADA